MRERGRSRLALAEAPPRTAAAARWARWAFACWTRPLGGARRAGRGLRGARGVRLLDEAAEELPPGGAALARLDRIDVSGLDRRLGDVAMTVARGGTNTPRRAGGGA